jgi:hypothetical protein
VKEGDEGVAGDEDAVLTMFGEVSVPFWTAIFTWRYPVHDAQGNEITSIERMFGAGVQVGLPTFAYGSPVGPEVLPLASAALFWG